MSQDLARVMEDLWDDRVGFVKHIIGVTPTAQQGDALRALDQHPHVSIASGHGCGKSTVEAWSVLHYMTCRPFPKVPCTAPSKHQLYDILWAELSKWHRKMNIVFANQFQWTKEKFFHKLQPEEWFAVAHDYGYRYDSGNIDKKTVDGWFNSIMDYLGEPPEHWKRNLMYWAVRNFANGSWHKLSVKDKLT